MNKNDIKAVAYVAGIAVVTVVSLKETARIIREENTKRKEFEKNKNLDIQAILLAGRTITNRIHEGKYDGNFEAVLNDFNEQIEFEKIVIREK